VVPREQSVRYFELANGPLLHSDEVKQRALVANLNMPFGDS
jgi:hypothetical protein